MVVGGSALGALLGLAATVTFEISLPSTATAVLPTQGNAEVTADVLTADNLRYLGTGSFTTPTGSAAFLRFAFDAATASGLTMQSACSGGRSIDESSQGTSSMTGSSIDAASLSAVIDGVPVVFTAAAPPMAAFPATVELHQLRIDALSLSSGRLDLPGPSISTVAC